MDKTTTKSLSQLDQEFNNALREYDLAKIAKQCGKDVENLLEVLKLALERINDEIMKKIDEEFPYDPDEDDKEALEEELASQRHDW